MSFVAAKCTQCGADIEVDDSKEAGICKYCGTAFVTEKAITNYNTYVTNNNNYYGANVTIQNSENIDGLLLLVKRELKAENYGSKDLYQYLDEIVIKSSEGTKIIPDLFQEMGLYKLAETMMEQGDNFSQKYDIADLLMKYDPYNITGWLLEWKIGVSFKDVSVGENIIRLAKDSEKPMYEKEIYSYFVEHGPQCAAYKEYLEAIPTTYIESNKYIQDLLIEQVNKLGYFDEDEKYARIEYIKSILPSDRVGEIETLPLSTDSSGRCYIATCVYGSYDCPQVWTLRRFRDSILNETWHGRLFIKCYYAVSPALVQWFGQKKSFRSFWKTRLDKMVSNLNKRGIDDTFYKDRY